MIRNARFVLYAVLLSTVLVALYVAKNWVLLARYVSHPGDFLATPIDWYSPKDRIAGTPDAKFPVARGTELTISYDALKEAMDYAKSQRSEALIIARHGKIELEKYWFDVDRSTLFNPGSMSGALVALLIGASIEDGHLQSADDYLSRYLPEFEGDERRTLRVRDALEMVTGLEILAPSANLLSKFVRHYMGNDFQHRLLALDAWEPPGTFRYNPSNVDLLGIVVERAAGRRYADYLSMRIWQPIGAIDASMYLDRDGGFVLASCCLFSTPLDWVRIGQLILSGGRAGNEQIVSSAWIDEMLAASAANPAFGRLIWRAQDAAGAEKESPGASPDCAGNEEAFISEDLIYLCGEGYQRVYIVPSLRLVIVRTGGIRGGWAPDWEESRLPNIIARGVDTS